MSVIEEWYRRGHKYPPTYKQWLNFAEYLSIDQDRERWEDERTLDPQYPPWRDAVFEQECGE